MRFDRLVREFLDEEEQMSWHVKPRETGLILFRKMLDDTDQHSMPYPSGPSIDSATQTAMSTPSPSAESASGRQWDTSHGEKDHVLTDVYVPVPNFGGAAPAAAPLPWWIRILAHTQTLVTGCTTLGVLYFRRAHAFYYVAASLATSFLAKGLKKVIRQPRPSGASEKQTSGMPSTHSSAVTFMGLYLAVILLFCPSGDSSHGDMTSMATNVNSTTTCWTQSATFKWTAIFGLLSFPPLVMHSRVRLRMHTPAQCTAGAILGAMCCAFFTALWRQNLASSGIVAKIDGVLQAI